jgi:hypothetical protein
MPLSCGAASTMPPVYGLSQSSPSKLFTESLIGLSSIQPKLLQILQFLLLVCFWQQMKTTASKFCPTTLEEPLNGPLSGAYRMIL